MDIGYAFKCKVDTGLRYVLTLGDVLIHYYIYIKLLLLSYYNYNRVRLFE